MKKLLKFITNIAIFTILQRLQMEGVNTCCIIRGKWFLCKFSCASNEHFLMEAFFLSDFYYFDSNMIPHLDC